MTRDEPSVETHRERAAALIGVTGALLVGVAILASIAWLFRRLLRLGTIPAMITIVALLGIFMVAAALAIDPEVTL